MPDGKGYLILLADGTVLKFGSATTGPIAGLASPAFGPGSDSARAISVMPDGAGYIVLDKLGSTYKYGSALQGAVGSGTTPNWGIDIGRDITIVSAFGIAFGYYVLDASGNVSGTSGLARSNEPGIDAVQGPLAGDRHLRREAVAPPQRRQHAARQLSSSLAPLTPS